MLRSLVDELVDWMYDTIANYNVSMALSSYLMAQRERKFKEYLGEFDSTLGDPRNNCLQLASETASLWWNFLLEGRVSQQWMLFAKTGLGETMNTMSLEGWTRRFIDRLLQVTRQTMDLLKLQRALLNQRRFDCEGV